MIAAATLAAGLIAAMGSAAPASAIAGVKGGSAGDPDGQAIYIARCAACHMPDGTGIAGAFPPLAGSSWATGDERIIVNIVLHGLTGPIEVDGEPYAGLMPPLGAALSDAEIAAVASYVRSSWGNDAPAIAAETVAGVRAATDCRDEAWTGVELFDGLEIVK